MKKIRCPKCDTSILFEPERYEPGSSLVFECPECRKQFKIRLPSRQDAPKEEEEPVVGSLLVVENAFHLQQVIPLHKGTNVVGRYVRGSNINCPIKTVDPSMDTLHCRIEVSANKRGELLFTLSDAPSGTGTFVGTEILGDRERRRIEDGTVITLGATTVILRVGTEEQQD
ncbi:MAG: FHA domain-containing protein [Bacteroidaceae bacterium]|nr:FHA domain-containing protein [Bacteroidaceae bacterium]